MFSRMTLNDQENQSLLRTKHSGYLIKLTTKVLEK